MRIMVTGGAGFLGSHLCDRLVADGHSVVCADNLKSGRRENLRQLEGHPRFEFQRCDVCEPFDFGPVDFVYHLASLASPEDYMRWGLETLDVGARGTRNALEAAKRYNAGFFLASTSECYGDPEVHPQPESYWGHVNPVGPRSVYDESKRFAEALTTAYHRYLGVDVRIVRIFNTYGPRLQPHDGRVISNFMRQALLGEPITIYGDGSQTRSFCYVSDEIEGIVRLAASGIQEPVNIGNPGEFTMLECAQLVLEVTGSKSPLVFAPLPHDDPKRRRPEIAKAKSLLGWEPQINLRRGLELSLEYFQETLGIPGPQKVTPLEQPERELPKAS